MLGEEFGRGLDLYRGDLAYQVRIHLASDLRAGMAEDHLHDLDRYAAREQQRTGAVARIVQPDHRQAAIPDVHLERRRDATRPQRRTVRGPAPCHPLRQCRVLHSTVRPRLQRSSEPRHR